VLFWRAWARTIAQLTQHLFQGHHVAAGGGALALLDGRQLLRCQLLVVVGNVLEAPRGAMRATRAAVEARLTGMT